MILIIEHTSKNCFNRMLFSHRIWQKVIVANKDLEYQLDKESHQHSRRRGHREVEVFRGTGLVEMLEFPLKWTKTIQTNTE